MTEFDSTRGTTTITLSIPKTTKGFFNDLAEDGYNRSQIMLKMIEILEILYRKHNSYPGGLPKAIERLKENTQRGISIETPDT